MKQHRFSRTELLIGSDNLEKLKNAKVVVLGIGGVGSYAVEALARSGVGHIVLVDDDDICLTNVNRQIHALNGTIGQKKTEAMADRIRLINPQIEITTIDIFIDKDNASEVIPLDSDFVIDAVDTVTAKLSIIMFCKENDIEVISCLGTGNKFRPELFEITDIHKTSVCPLAKVMRHELKKRRVKKLTVLYSKELPTKPRTDDIVTCKEGCVCTGDNKKCTIRRQIPGSMSYVPPVAGFIISSHVVNKILGII
ncbi:MAG: ThiF family adenylyltransferase [Lachnospirales bacterium]